LYLLESLFVQDDGALGPIAWWELRRIPYNLSVAVVGILSIFAMELIGSTVVQAGDDFVEPFAILAGVVFCGCALNLWYTLGWVEERRLPIPNRSVYRKVQFRKRLLYSCAIVTLPCWLAILAWFVNKL
jgi:hypothetical protein